MCFLLVAVCAGYALETRREVALQALLICAALLAPLVYESGTTDETLTRALVAIPSVLPGAGLITYMRERLEADRAALGELAARDPLTGVGNYRSFGVSRAGGRQAHTARARVGARRARPRRLQADKRAPRHLEGDHVLRQVGRTLAAGVRVEDLVARQGGDEFSVIAPETGAHGAALLASRIEDAVRDISAGGRRVRASTGWACSRPTAAPRTPCSPTLNDALRTGRREGQRPLAGRAGAGTVDLARAAMSVTGRATRRRRQ